MKLRAGKKELQLSVFHLLNNSTAMCAVINTTESYVYDRTLLRHTNNLFLSNDKGNNYFMFSMTRSRTWFGKENPTNMDWALEYNFHILTLKLTPSEGL